MANPPDDFVDIPFTPDANAMADSAIAALVAKWPGWVPNDADPEVVLIEALAPLAEAAEQMAAQMPGEAIRAIGALYGIPYDDGSPAQTTLTFTFIDGQGYTIPAGSQVNIDGYAFSVSNDAVIAPNAGAGPFRLAGIPVVSVANAAAASGLTGAIAVSLNLPPSVAGFTLDSPTTDGTDPMDDTVYTNQVVAKLRLRADALITANDFALAATMQPGVGFAWASGNTARQISVALADPQANPVPTSVKSQVAALFASPSVRSVNVTFSLLDPTYTVVNVTWRATAIPGQDVNAVRADVNAMLTSLLSPLGSAKSSDTLIRVNRIISLIGGLQFVSFVQSVTLSSPTSGAVVQSNGDLQMPGGLASLPTVGTLAGTVDVSS